MRLISGSGSNNKYNQLSSNSTLADDDDQYDLELDRVEDMDQDFPHSDPEPQLLSTISRNKTRALEGQTELMEAGLSQSHSEPNLVEPNHDLELDHGLEPDIDLEPDHDMDEDESKLLTNSHNKTHRHRNKERNRNSAVRDVEQLGDTSPNKFRVLLVLGLLALLLVWYAISSYSRSQEFQPLPLDCSGIWWNSSRVDKHSLVLREDGVNGVAGLNKFNSETVDVALSSAETNFTFRFLLFDMSGLQLSRLGCKHFFYAAFYYNQTLQDTSLPITDLPITDFSSDIFPEMIVDCQDGTYNVTVPLKGQAKDWYTASIMWHPHSELLGNDRGDPVYYHLQGSPFFVVLT